MSWEDFESHLGTWVEARLVLGGQGPEVVGGHDDESHGGKVGLAKETAFQPPQGPLPEDNFWLLLSLVTCRACPGQPRWTGPGLRPEAQEVCSWSSATLL